MFDCDYAEMARALERSEAACRQLVHRARTRVRQGEDATWTADGGGKVPATRRVFRGADRVVRFLLGVERKWKGVTTHRVAWLNGEPANVTEAGGRIFATTAIETDGERIVAFYRVLNPDKLRHVADCAGAP